MSDLADIMMLEQVGPNLFAAKGGKDGWRGLYGGQVVAQALGAAMKTVPVDRPVHSLHAYFLRAGAFDVPVVFDVIADRDGGSFSSRRVLARQGDSVILSCAASFHDREDGPEHRFDNGRIAPPPDALPDCHTAADGKLHLIDWSRPPFGYFDIRPVEGCGPRDRGAGEARSALWFRLNRDRISDNRMQSQLLAYASDMFLLATAMRPHREQFSRESRLASLDHTIWFHAAPQVDDWLLFEQMSPWAGQGRGLAFGTISDRAGRPIATVAQEGLMRMGGAALHGLAPDALPPASPRAIKR